MSEKWTRCILAIHIICSCLLSAHVRFYIIGDLFKNVGFLTITNMLIKYCGVIVVCLITAIESYCKRSIQRKFWQIYRQIVRDFTGEDHDIVFRNYFIQFGTFFVVALGIYVRHAIITISVFSGIKLCFAFSYLSVMTMQDMRVFHYIFFVHLLDHQLHAIGLEMERLADASERQKISHESLKRIRIYHDLVHELSNCINEVFGWSNMAIILYLFTRLAVDLNRIYYKRISELDTDIKRSYFLFSHFVDKCSIKSNR